MAKKDTSKHRPKKHKPAKSYPLEFKMQAMTLLQENDMNMCKTARELGVSQTTVAGWRKKYLGEIERKQMESQVAERIVEKQEDRRRDLLDEIHKSKMALLKRLQDITESEQNMDKIQTAIKTLCDIDGTSKGMEDQGEQPTNMLTLIQTLTQNFNNTDYESKSPITIVGNKPE
ncbi:MAG: transposase [bacterium]